MHRALVQGWRDGHFAPGEPVPSVRELAKQYELSSTVVTQTMRELLREGVLYTVPSVGTYFGQRPAVERGLFLIVFPYPAVHNTYFSEVQAGFEEEVSALGGFCLALTYEGLDEFREHVEFGGLGGIFEMRMSQPLEASPVPALIDSQVPQVRFLPYFEPHQGSDTIAFDDFDGGRQAARHLLQAGHRRIAFLGLHAAGRQEGFRFSLERERGWRAEMTAAGLSTEGLSFCPDAPVELHLHIQEQAACEVAKALIGRSDIPAVVTVGEMATSGLIRALEAGRVPPERWPAIVSFDDSPLAAHHLVSAMRLPWRELGHQAARMLWERGHGLQSAEFEQREVPMRLIRRLTSRPSWSRDLKESRLRNLEAVPANSSI